MSEAALNPFFMANHQYTTRRDWIFDRMMNIQVDTNHLNDDETICSNDQSKIEVNYWPQQLDNFNSSDTRSWQQHYQIQRKFVNKNSTQDEQVIFLLIGGEGPISNKWVCYDNYTYLEAAKQYNALVIQLEHRFFGANQGDIINDLSTVNLKYLTTEQALADIKVFIDGFTLSNNFINSKWIAFGGSYPGTMAAYLRYLYPNITQGNIASSAPLTPVVDYYQYAQVMEQTINSTSKECYKAVGDAFKQLLEKILTDEGRLELNDALHIEPPFYVNETVLWEDLNTVTSTIFGAFQGIIQYTYDGRGPESQHLKCPRQNIECACNYMTDKSMSLLDRLYKVSKLGNAENYSSPAELNLSRSYTDSISDLLITTLNVSTMDGAAAGRGWMWLSCNEYGWLQSTTASVLFGNAVPISYYIKMCADIFDQQLTNSIINSQIQSTIRRYGYPGERKTTNLFLPNGGYDPWSALGDYVDDTANHVITHLTPGAAHCSDMYGQYDQEPAGLNETRTLFWSELDYYLSLDSTHSNSSSPPPVTPSTSGPPPETTTAGSGGQLSTLLTCILAFIVAFVFMVAH